MSERSGLGRELRQLREASGMTLAEVSNSTGIREAYLSAIEDDREEPTARTLERLLRFLDPAGTSHERIARLLTAPELDITGEYASTGHPQTGTPVLPGDARRADPQQARALDAVAAAAERVWRDKTDVELTDAAGRLDEYTDAGKCAIEKELGRRGLTRLDNSAGDPLLKARVEEGELQFDRVVTAPAPSMPPGEFGVICAVCQTHVATDYYDINGKTCCSRCRTAVQSAAEPPTEILPLITAGVFGFGAGVLGAVIYYAVLAVAHLQIGFVAILIGYMVGYAVRKGAGGRGGLRFQLLAVALTYASVALAYTPLAFKAAIDASRNGRGAPIAATSANRNGRSAPVTATSANRNGQSAPPAATTVNRASAPATGGERAVVPPPSGGRLLMGLVALLGVIAALPVLMVVGSFPSGLISAFIIFIGMRQAWSMTGVPRLRILGPYRVGAAPASTLA